MGKVIAVIPARFASTRFPGKPLALINGKPMIEWVIAGAKKAKLVDQILVATDHLQIAEVARACGVEAVMTESDLPSGTDRIWAACKDLDCEVVINIQGDEPLSKGFAIDSLIQPMLAKTDLEMATLAHELESKDLDSSTVVKVLLNQRNEAIYFSRFPIPFSVHGISQGAPSQEIDGVCRHVGMYAYRKEFLRRFCAQSPVLMERAESLEQLRALYLGAKIQVVMTQEQSWGVDTPEDVEKIESVLNQGKK